MSAITQSQKGDRIVIICDFVSCKAGEEFEWGKEREFLVGDVVYFEDWYKNENVSQEYLSWFIRYRTEDGELYEATQTFFVVYDDWLRIVEAASNIDLDELDGFDDSELFDDSFELNDTFTVED